MTQNTMILKPNDTVRVKHDTGEFYADFPSQVILVASEGSVGRVVRLDEFKADFKRRLGRQKLSREKQQSYKAHFAVVGQAMEQGLQYPIRFEKVTRPSSPVDILRARPKAIELVDGAAIEKVGSGGVLDQVTGLFKGGSSPGKIAWPATSGVHDQAKFTDVELAIAMAHGGPISHGDISIVYLRYTSILPYHNFWYRLKQVVAEAAYDIIDSLRFPKHNHAGCSWEEIANLIEQNDPKKPLWYTYDQREALVVAAQNIYRMEKERGYEAMVNYVDPEVVRQLQKDPRVMPGLGDKLKKGGKR